MADKINNDNPQWQVPDFLTAKPHVVSGWVEEVLQDRESLLKTTRQYRDIDKAFSLIAGEPDSSANEQRSKMNTNRAKRSVREIIASLSDVRQADGYDTENKAFKDEAEMINKAMRALWYERSFDRSLKRSTQWMTATGTSWIWPVYRKVRMGPGADSSLCFDAYGLLDVFPYMRGFDNDPQNTYATIIVKPTPMPQAHSMFPAFQARLKPMSKKRYDSSVANKRMSLADMFRNRTTSANRAYEGDYAELRYTLVRDMRVNATGLPIPLGSPGGSESYVVPFIGQEIPSMDVLNGVRKMREATIDDCYLWPNMRLIITADGLDDVLYDGPNFDWSGMMPAEYAVDSWPWERIGFSLLRDIYDIERARQHGERAIDQVIKHRMDPGVAYDNTRLATKEAESFDPWKERGRLGFSGEVDENTFRTIIPQWLLDVPQAAMAWQEYLNNEMDYTLGLNAISAIAKAKLSVDGDAMQQLLELAGPLVKDISRSMEPPTRDVMETSKYIIFQWYNTRRLMNYVGPDGITPVTLDFDPNNLYPSHLPGEDNNNPSAFSARERAKWFAHNVHTTITPGSLHAITQTSQKLMMLQMWRAGFPIPPDDVAKALDMHNWGTIDGNTGWEKWQTYKKMEIEFASQIQQLQQSLPGFGPPGGAPQQAGAGAPPGGGKAKPGRPATGNKPPQAQVKQSASGPRAVVSESG